MVKMSFDNANLNIFIWLTQWTVMVIGDAGDEHGQHRVVKFKDYKDSQR